MSVLAGPVGPHAAGQLHPGWWAAAFLPDEHASAHCARPGWVAGVESAIAAPAAPGRPLRTGSWQEAFATPLRPFLAMARDRLVTETRRSMPAGQAEPEPIGETFTAVLAPQLARIAVRAMVAELSAARTAGCLTGEDGRQRFEDFLRQMSAPAGLAALFAEYPVLARLLGTASVLTTEAVLEMLARFAADRTAVVDMLLDGVDPGPVVAIEPGLGDRHGRGRSVAAVSFADGRKIVCKPRDLQAYLRFGEIVGWLNERVPGGGLRTARVVARPGYGWLEFVPSRPLAQPGDADRFYRREGMLLAALYAIQATDIHYENLIADADQPVLVDAETLFHPDLPAAQVAADPAGQALAASVYGAGLLPAVVVGQAGVMDLSGMGGGTGETCPDPALDWDPPATDQSRLIWRPAAFAGARNRPHFRGRFIEPADHEAAVIEGFRLSYDAIARDRRAFIRLIESCGDVEVRIVVRTTRSYSRLLDESTQPGLLRNASARHQALHAALEASANSSLAGRLARHELASLWAGDIPLMTGRPASPDVWTSNGHCLRGVLERTGLSRALDKIAAMGEADRRDQEWVISASLATRRPAGSHRPTGSAPDLMTPVAAEPGQLLAAACGLADAIMARGKTRRNGVEQRRVNWLGLQLVDDIRWLVLPMGASLGDGYLGVALFLAQLAALTGIGRYAEEARRAVGPVPELLSVLSGRTELLAAIGCGGTRGLGGISYGLARLATLLDDGELSEWARTAVQMTALAAELPSQPGWAAGTAGCLAAMTAVAAELGSASAAGLARACADRLTDLVESTDGRCVPGVDPARAGFAAGPAGIGWALHRFAAAEPGLRRARAGQHAVRYAGEQMAAAGHYTGYGWCSGTAGIVMACTCLADGASIPEVVGVLTGHPLLSDLSLCHGELGVTEALTVLAASGQAVGVPGVAAQNPIGPGIARQSAALQGATVQEARRHRAGLILAAIRRRTRYCGTPGGVPTPGLLTGLAGIGYGLLRLGYAERVPSVLLLEPTARSPSQPGLTGPDGDGQPRSEQGATSA